MIIRNNMQQRQHSLSSTYINTLVFTSTEQSFITDYIIQRWNRNWMFEMKIEHRLRESNRKSYPWKDRHEAFYTAKHWNAPHIRREKISTKPTCTQVAATSRQAKRMNTFKSRWHVVLSIHGRKQIRACTCANSDIVQSRPVSTRSTPKLYQQQ